MYHCKHCQAALVCQHVPPNRIYQCPACGYPNTFGDYGGRAGLSKFARKSLVYAGGAVILLLAALALVLMELPWPAGLAGPPSLVLGMLAAYFSVRAFLLSRYQPFSTRSKYEAIFGGIGGGCLGVIIGGTITVAVIVSATVQWFSAETRERSLVTQALDATAKFELPDSIDFVPAVASKTPVRKRIELWDHKSFNSSRNRLYLMWANSVYTTQWGSAEQNRNGIRERSIRMITGNLAHKQAEITESEDLQWVINGEPQKITKAIWQASEDEEDEVEGIEFVTYQCLFDANHNTYCITFWSQLPDPTVSESEIKAIFESFEPVGSGW